LKPGSPGSTAGVHTAARTKPWVWIEWNAFVTDSSRPD
jgi:hypothetical protein